jgi:hypothetical protein
LPGDGEGKLLGVDKESKTMKLCNRILTLLLVVGLAWALTPAPGAAAQATIYVDDDACPGPGSGTQSDPYCSIQDAIDAAASGDTVYVAAGTYAEQLTIDKSLTLEGEAGTYPAIRPELNSASKYDTVITVRADDVTIRGFDISNALGVIGSSMEHHAIWDGSWTLGPSGLTVDGCVIHDIEHGVRSYGPDLTVTNCEMYSLLRSGVHASGPYQNQPLPMIIQHNWFHDWHDYYKEGAGVHVKYDSRVGEVSYNYISGMRMGIAYYYGGPKSSYGRQIVFAHNTIDMDYDPGTNTVLMTMGFSFWGTGTDADQVVVRDNILANARWFGIYQEGATLQGAITVDNNLFYNNYWHYWPDYQYPYQWFGNDPRAQAGWTGGANGFAFSNNLTVQDPLFILEGAGPEAQWALDCGSPALNAASDGANIGAWQGQPNCVVEVDIDIKPGSYPNSINYKNKGKVPVAILSTADFSAPNAVNPDSPTFGPTGDEASLAFCNASPEDVNEDGYEDLVCHFDIPAMGFQCGDVEGILRGITVDDVPIEGRDSVRIVPCK